MDIRVDNMQQVNATTQTQQAQQSGEDFKFTLMSSIEEAGLSERLSVMMQEITKHYRRLIQEFMNEIVNRSHKFSRENFLDRRGRHRVYGMIKRVNVVLDELAGELIKEEKDTLAILSKVDEIRGLLLDIIT